MPYMLVKSDEDGNPISWLDSSEVNDIAQLMEDYSVKRFMPEVPADADPNYWAEGEALLIEYRICQVKPKTVVQAWEIE